MKHHLTCRSIDSSVSNISYHCDMVWDNVFKGLATRLRKLQNKVGIVLRGAYDVGSKNVMGRNLGQSAVHDAGSVPYIYIYSWEDVCPTL